MSFFMERKNEGKIKLPIFSHGVVAYRFGPHRHAADELTVCCERVADSFRFSAVEKIYKFSRKNKKEQVKYY